MAKKGLNAPFFADLRGEIHRLNVKGVKFNALFTKKGALRSGDYHPVVQYNIVLKGKLQITLRKGNKDVKMIKKPGELIKIPPNTPHLYKFLADSVILEWWGGPFKVKYYQPYRKIIEASLRRAASKGRK
ncbi:MAG: hypothetical protein EPN86_01435 [Nanoarchaeota archaeon]|nr:MAG: hypothetical protein EPN86_01435 [Nanoarchaeota archaeon]